MIVYGWDGWSILIGKQRTYWDIIEQNDNAAQDLPSFLHLIGTCGDQTATLVCWACANVGVKCVLTSIWRFINCVLARTVWYCDNAVSYLYVEKCFWPEKPWATKKGQPVCAKQYNTPMKYNPLLVDPIKMYNKFIATSQEPHDLNAALAERYNSSITSAMQGNT